MAVVVLLGRLTVVMVLLALRVRVVAVVAQVVLRVVWAAQGARAALGAVVVAVEALLQTPRRVLVALAATVFAVSTLGKEQKCQTDTQSLKMVW
jgi:HJR/Mrr/RecB family endonuclease